jgi:hypothetical protein
MLNISHLLKAAAIAATALLLACSPKYDWREVRGNGAPFMISLPAKPASHARMIDLDGIKVTMTMTAAEVDGVSFAVGTAELPDPLQAQKALVAMKTALVRNIGGTVKQEKSSSPAMIEIEAAGSSRLLLGRFIARDNRVYQLLVVGDERKVSREEAETFFTSFKPS